MRSYIYFLALIFLGLMLSGCGGGSESGSQQATGQRGTISVQIHWPQLPVGRLIPVASQSIKLEISISSQQSVVTVVNRQSGVDTQTIHIGLPAANAMLVASAYPGLDGAGVAQATGTVPITVQVNQDTTVALSMGSTISSIQVKPDNADIGTGQNVNLIATAYDVKSNVVLTSASMWTWSMVAGSDAIVSLTPNGTQCNVSGIANGVVSVKATEKESGIVGSSTVTVSTFDQNGGTIYGTVTDSNGNSLPGIHVTTSYGFRDISTTTDSNGQYSLDHVPAGDRVVSFYGKGSTTNNQVTIAAGGRIELDVQMQPFSGSITASPVITLSTPIIDDIAATATLSGTITQLDSNQAVVVVNGAEYLFTVGADGSFNTVASLNRGANTVYIRAANTLGMTVSSALSIPISGTNPIAGYWLETLNNSGSTGYTLGNTGFDDLHADGTYNENDEHQGTYTYANGVFHYVTGSTQSYYVKWISANEMLWTNTNANDGRVYTLTRDLTRYVSSHRSSTSHRGQGSGSPGRK